MARIVKCKTCSDGVFLGVGATCDGCGEIGTPNLALEYARTQERLYGTAYGNGKYNAGLGEKVYGPSDFRRKMKQQGLRLKERGEPSTQVQGKKEAAEKQRRHRQELIGKNLRSL